MQSALIKEMNEKLQQRIEEKKSRETKLDPEKYLIRSDSKTNVNDS